MERPWDSRTSHDVTACRRHHIAEHRRCGLDPARTGTIEHQFTGGFGLNKHRVLSTVYRSKRVHPTDERGIYPCGNTDTTFGGVHPLSNSEQFNDVPGASCSLDL